MPCHGLSHWPSPTRRPLTFLTFLTRALFLTRHCHCHCESATAQPVPASSPVRRVISRGRHCGLHSLGSSLGVWELGAWYACTSYLCSKPRSGSMDCISHPTSQAVCAENVHKECRAVGHQLSPRISLPRCYLHSLPPSLRSFIPSFLRSLFCFSFELHHLSIHLSFTYLSSIFYLSIYTFRSTLFDLLCS